MTELLPVILAGGSGTRLWPLSRELYPKQFLRLYGEHTMLQATLQRLDGLPIAPPYVVCNDEHRFLVAEQCRAIDRTCGAIILEPAVRSTAPAIALAAFRAVRNGANPILLVMPADHYIEKPDGFRSAVRDGLAVAGSGALLTFGVVPEGPETGYGYIKRGVALQGSASRVAAFTEKPNRERAEQFLADGNYFWNSGIFMFAANSFLEELRCFRPDIHDACAKAIANETTDLDFVRPGKQFIESPIDSIDYAVMERTSRSAMIPLAVGWSDLGSWSALWDIAKRDADGNSTIGDVISVDTHNSFIHADSRLVATIGIDDAVVVETADAVLVARKDVVQDVKRVVDSLRDCRTRNEHRSHVRVFRPWGSYESVENGERYQVKRITVNPGSSLSYQMHHHRAEHWVVVKGTARVQKGDDVFLLAENESTYIPLGTKHRLTNPGKVPLELIEVQVGAYLGEDDIVRFEDKYGRN
jgi:mannose-1-phosphate guanylyltransferase/mannose-6-phosphate isomerase